MKEKFENTEDISHLSDQRRQKQSPFPPSDHNFAEGGEVTLGSFPKTTPVNFSQDFCEENSEVSLFKEKTYFA